MRSAAVLWLCLLLTATAYGERYEYRSDVNRDIPDYDSVGVTDTVLVPAHIAIEDINVYVGVGTEGHLPWAEEVWIDVYSPQRVRVRINDWRSEQPPINWYWVWYDTEREVDGPGSLDDYVGSDARGFWVMHVFDMFEDRQVHWYYWIVEIYGEPMTGLEDEDPAGIPGEYTLLGNYPNPFNSSTAIKFGLPEQAGVRIDIYDSLGRLVRSLAEASLAAGYHSIIWDGTDERRETVSSGVYLIRMKAGERTFDKRMVLLK